jgi:hypothetical protein
LQLEEELDWSSGPFFLIFDFKSQKVQSLEFFDEGKESATNKIFITCKKYRKNGDELHEFSDSSSLDVFTRVFR